ncbi:serine/threonine-protein kinase [Streptomyces flaveus]|uniref:serine/threonine-protein kinase n=1 Tax=Streptomyces flaveus TaxID=66370 RepID=UPI0033284774
MGARVTLLEGDQRSVGGYRLEGRLGAGGMGVVYRARSVSGRQVAVKVIRPELVQDADFRTRFRLEVESARRVSGAFTAPVVDADTEAEVPWLATLFVPGPSLAERVTGQGPLTVPEVRRLAAGLVEALRDIHRAGLVHRDLKPGNVLLAEDGPRVIDFGIARAVDAARLTSTGLVVGTPPFMAPEQFREATSGPASDVFSLGSVLTFAATGRGPFDGDSPHTVGYRVVYEDPDLTGLPPALEPLVDSCLSKDPGRRPTVPELLAALGDLEPAVEAAAGTPVDAPPRKEPSPPAAPQTPDPRRAYLTATGSTAAVDGNAQGSAGTQGSSSTFREDARPAAFPPPPPPPQPPNGPGASAYGGTDPEGSRQGPSSPADSPATAWTGSAAEARKRSGARSKVLVGGAAALAVTGAAVAAMILVPMMGGDSDESAQGSNGSQKGNSSSAATGGPEPAPACEPGGTLTAGGSSRQARLLERLTDDYSAACTGSSVTYEGKGSGDGVFAFAEDKVALAVTDGKLRSQELTPSNERCKSGDAIQLPINVMPVAVIYRLDGVDSLTLDAKTLAGIFQGKVTKWNDPKIAALNPGETLPSIEVKPFYLSNESGTNLTASQYLAQAAGYDWPDAPSTAMPAKAGTGRESAAEIATSVTSGDGTIAFVDPTQVDSGSVNTAKLNTGAAKPVALTLESTAKTVAEGQVGKGNDLVVELPLATRAEGAYPIVELGYALVCSKGNNPQQLPVLRSFLDYVISEKAQSTAAGLSFGPLPDPLATRVRAAVRGLQ